MEGGMDDMDSYTRLRIRLAVAHAEAVKEGDEPRSCRLSKNSSACACVPHLTVVIFVSAQSTQNRSS